MKSVEMLCVLGAILVVLSVAEATSVPNLYNIEMDGKLYFLSKTAKTCKEAEADCIKNGGHLVTIPNAAVNTFIKEKANGAKIWIGLNDLQKEGDWRWLNGDEVSYINWQGGEPNDYAKGRGSDGEDCVEMYTSGKWNDLFHGKYIGKDWTRQYICQKVYDIQKFGFDYFVSNSPKTCPEAEADCKNKGGHLVTIPNAIVNDFVKKYATNKLWIGFNDLQKEGQFGWFNAEKDTYTNWARNEPNNYQKAEDCTEMYKQGTWNDLFHDRANVKRNYMCQKDTPYNIQAFGNYYFVGKTPKTCQAAQADCKSKGGNLVTIPNEQVNTEMKKLAKGKPTWIGLNDFSKEGTFKWFNGDQVTYTKWQLREPNDYAKGKGSDGEDCVEMYGSGNWNDLFHGKYRGRDYKRQYICQKVTSFSSGKEGQGGCTNGKEPKPTK